MAEVNRDPSTPLSAEPYIRNTTFFPSDRFVSQIWLILFITEKQTELSYTQKCKGKSNSKIYR